MREVTVRIEFVSPCLGNKCKKVGDNGKQVTIYKMPRLGDQVRFEATWWLHKMRFAAELINRHHKAAKKIAFDLAVDGRTSDNVEQYYRRYVNSTEYVRHECFPEGTVIGINCAVPDEISNEDLWKLMEVIGKYKGISPYGHNEYGHFVVNRVVPKN